jgi:hypothetical protein
MGFCSSSSGWFLKGVGHERVKEFQWFSVLIEKVGTFFQ